MSSVLELKKKLRYMVPEIRLALIKEGRAKAKGIACPDDMEQFVEPLKFFSEEHFISFHIDAKNTIIGYHDISHGTLNASLVHPREVFKAALLTNAYGIIVAHNHPAGSLESQSRRPRDYDAADKGWCAPGCERDRSLDCQFKWYAQSQRKIS